MKVSNILLTAASVFFLSFSTLAQSAGDIAFVGFNADGDPANGYAADGFAFFVLNDIEAYDTIYFTDNDWDGTSFSIGGEGAVLWYHTSTVSAGQIVVIDNYVGSNVAQASLGTVTEVDNGMNLGASNETIYAYTGTAATPTTFLTALSNTNGANNNITNTGLVEDSTALGISGGNDVMVMSADLSSVCLGVDCIQNIYDENNWTTDNGGGDQSADGGGSADFPLSVTNPSSGAPLPVELISFKAKLQKGSISLVWETATEIDNDFFLIEKSKDRGRTFKVIGRMKGAGTVNSSTSYSFEDFQERSRTNVYYRLKQVDFNGAFEYSNIIKAPVASLVSEATVFPNPFQDKIYLRSDYEGALTIALYDRSTRTIYRKDYIVSGMIQELGLPADLKVGVYHLKVILSSGETLFRQIIKEQ